VTREKKAPKIGDGGADCTCDGCVAACKHKPGWLAPGDAEKIAAHLDVPVERLFRERLAIDWWVGGVDGDEDVLVLSPVAVGREPGGEYGEDPGGWCTFLVNDRCSIHAVKPRECRLVGHPTPPDLHREMARMWETAQDQIVELRKNAR